jgi:hypothetical protein
MALPPADPEQYRRTQRRRAWIGWVGGLLVVALFVAAGIAGGGGSRHHGGSEGVFGYHLTSHQYAHLKLGEEESTVVDRLGKVGLPENLTEPDYIGLFPPHEEDVSCSYWEISDAAATVVRLCFSSPAAVLVQKLERNVSGGGGGSTV